MPVSNLAASDFSGVPYDQWTVGAGAGKVAVILTNDGDTSYIQQGVSDQRQCYNAAWPAAAASIGVVNSLVAKGYLREFNGEWSGGVGCRNASGESTSNAALTSSFALYQHTCVRPGGGAWTAADLASGVTWLQVRNYTTPGTGSVRCTMLYFTLDYEIGGGCVMIQLLSALLPLLGAGLGLQHMRGISAELWRRTRTRLRPDEYAAALASLRDYRRPAFAF